MAKVSSAPEQDYPSYVGSSVSINNDSKADTSYLNGYINSSYKMGKNEKDIFDYAQTTLKSILPQLNVFSKETQDSLQSQLDAYKIQGLETIDDIYTPMIKNLQNDIASRFGNVDNSIFMDNLNSIESNRGKAVGSFVNDMLTKLGELQDKELSRRYNFADFLNNLQNQAYDNALRTINVALGGSSSGNSYNNNLYNSLYKQALKSSFNSDDISAALSTAMSLAATGA